MTKANDLVSFVKTKLGTPYVYGMKGEKLSKSGFDYLRKAYPSSVWSSDSAKIGKVCVDCSGLISWCTGILRGSSSYKDTATKVLPISRISEAVPGCALWKSGHIGVYIGNGECIEARGSAYGTVTTRVKDRPWTHILWLKDIDYSAPSVPSAPKTSGKNLIDQSLSGDYRTTDALHLRADAGTNSKSLCVMPKGALVGNYGRYKVVNGAKWLYVLFPDKGIRGYCSAKYLKKVK